MGVIEKQIPTLNPDYYLEKMDNEILLYSMSGTKAVYLNETAALIWEVCDGIRTVQEIIDLLTHAYPQEEAQIGSDVVFAIETLVENDAMTLK